MCCMYVLQYSAAHAYRHAPAKICPVFAYYSAPYSVLLYIQYVRSMYGARSTYIYVLCSVPHGTDQWLIYRAGTSRASGQPEIFAGFADSSYIPDRSCRQTAKRREDDSGKLPTDSAHPIEAQSGQIEHNRNRRRLFLGDRGRGTRTRCRNRAEQRRARTRLSNSLWEPVRPARALRSDLHLVARESSPWTSVRCACDDGQLSLGGGRFAVAAGLVSRTAVIHTPPAMPNNVDGANIGVRLAPGVQCPDSTHYNGHANAGPRDGAAGPILSLRHQDTAHVVAAQECSQRGPWREEESEEGRQQTGSRDRGNRQPQTHLRDRQD